MFAEELRRYLSEATGRPVRLRVSDSASVPLRVVPDPPGPGLRVSLHRVFLEHGDELRPVIARFCVKPTPEVRTAIRAFLAEHHSQLVSKKRLRERRSGTAEGRVFDLRERADAVNRSFFEARLDFHIVWSKPVRRGEVPRRVTLGLWDAAHRTVLIHPLLDDPRVPTYYIDYVIYHELTHAFVPSRPDSAGRLRHHSRDFYVVETAFPHYELARAWEQRQLRAVMRDWYRPKRAAAPLNAAQAVLDLFRKSGG
ncbi:MAG: M48 family metallopeptidase [Candidatus Sumerlaeia bacterium]|nr:M48 family metallopeptidase [Candidatus Sumerlaeia bacterium]